MSDLERVLALTEELLRIESVTGDEGELGDWLEARLRQRDPHTLIRAGHSLCFAMRPPDPDKATLMLVGHTDTVPPADENPVRRQDDCLFGLGASDMKAADAVLLDAIERDPDCRYNLVGVLYAREEGPFVDSEMPQIIEAASDWFDRTDLAVCMEPTDNQLELGCLGTCHATVRFGGQRAHSARPWQGDNAIHKAAGLLTTLAGLEREEHLFHGLTFYEVLSATMVDYRGARNVVPEEFVVNVNYRFAPDKDEADVRARLDSLVGEDATYELDDFCPAGRVCGDNPLLEDLREVAPSDLSVRAKQAWTDVGRLSRLGIDAINWGPGATSQAHQAGEWVSIEAIERSRVTLAAWLGG
ncbi:MAG: succinyl-diaminopimelate desuccinylase [Planctomycetota bacterium]|nr:succinyl-diaminopimelate desuccinylase [Planctomycetota bacterium]